MILNSYFPIQIPIEFPRTVCPTIVQQVGVPQTQARVVLCFSHRTFMIFSSSLNLKDFCLWSSCMAWAKMVRRRPHAERSGRLRLSIVMSFRSCRCPVRDVQRAESSMPSFDGVSNESYNTRIFCAAFPHYADVHSRFNTVAHASGGWTLWCSLLLHHQSKLHGELRSRGQLRHQSCVFNVECEWLWDWGVVGHDGGEQQDLQWIDWSCGCWGRRWDLWIFRWSWLRKGFIYLFGHASPKSAADAQLRQPHCGFWRSLVIVSIAQIIQQIMDQIRHVCDGTLLVTTSP